MYHRWNMKPLQCKDCIFHVFLVVGTLLYRKNNNFEVWTVAPEFKITPRPKLLLAKTVQGKWNSKQLLTKYIKKKKRIGPKSSSSITFYFLSNQQQQHLGNSKKISYGSSYQGLLFFTGILLISDNSPSKTKKNLQQTTHSCYQLKHSHLPSLQIES